MPILERNFVGTPSNALYGLHARRDRRESQKL